MFRAVSSSAHCDRTVVRGKLFQSRMVKHRRRATRGGRGAAPREPNFLSDACDLEEIHEISQTRCPDQLDRTMSDVAKGSAKLQTYHCICTNLLLATTHNISELPQRSSPGLDHAYILPCPTVQREAPSLKQDDADGDLQATEPMGDGNSTVFISLTPARKVVIRRDDGFEKRHPLQCSRCNTTIGYHLDIAQTSKQLGMQEGPMEDVLYVLPGSMVTTASMIAGQLPSEQQIGLGIAAV